MVRTAQTTYEIWGDTQSGQPVAVRRVDGNITGFHTNADNILLMKDDLGQLHYKPAHIERINDFNNQVQQGKLARIR